VPPDNTILLGQKSERVRRLTASCIQSVVRLRCGYEMSMADAIDLARIHDVRSAVRIIEEKLELLQNVPQAMRFKLAATEAALTGGLSSREDIDNTVAVRRASIGPKSERQPAGVSLEILITGLQKLRRQWERWAREYSRFISRIASLHAEADRDLNSLHLEPETAKRARADLERVLLVALRKAGELELYVEDAG
jgi:SLT domain-containing protein